MINFKYKGTTYNFGLPFRLGQALTTGFATLVLVTSIAKQSRANGNVSCGHLNFPQKTGRSFSKKRIENGSQKLQFRV